MSEKSIIAMHVLQRLDLVPVMVLEAYLRGLQFSDDEIEYAIDELYYYGKAREWEGHSLTWIESIGN